MSQDILTDADSQPPLRRRPRATPDQRQVFIDFAEKHEDILDSLKPDYKALWKEVEELLNAGIGPKKSVEEWQANFKHWEYNLRAKKRIADADERGTGGGPASTRLTRFEERAFKILSGGLSPGGNDVPVIGLPTQENDDGAEGDCSVIEDENPPLKLKKAKNKKSPNKPETSDNISEILDLMKKRQEIDNQNAQNLNVLSSSVSTMADAMKTFAEAYAKQK